jgi:hypothetical protein
MNDRPLRYVWAYSAADVWTESWHTELLRRRRLAGFDVVNVCVTPPSLGRRWLSFPELDERWRHGDPALLQIYAELTETLANRDVLVLYNGANLHPEFVGRLDCLRVYSSGDDPEATDVLSRPCSPPFDVHLVNHPGMVQTYRSWGFSRVHFWPLGSQTFPEDVADLDDDALRDRGRRDIEGVFIGERNALKRERLDILAAAFPASRYHGNGWPAGRIGDANALYRRSRIGWNIHNSTGPINFRLYELAAHGVAQLCDNPDQLRAIFGPDECLGFSSMEQAIRMSRDLLADNELQAHLAVQAKRRWAREYHPGKIWERLVELAGRPTRPSNIDREGILAELATRSSSHLLRRTLWRMAQAPAAAKRLLRQSLHRLRGRCQLP